MGNAQKEDTERRKVKCVAHNLKLSHTLITASPAELDSLDGSSQDTQNTVSLSDRCVCNDGRWGSFEGNCGNCGKRIIVPGTYEGLKL